MNVLLDKEFLKELDNFSNKEVYARVTALTNNELPIEMIEGRITGGSINIDGTSAIRRTCSLSLIAQDININEFYWGLNNKIKLEVGLKNFINSNYPDIIWFPQGIYIITAFNTSLSTKGYNISINGQDKMCLLNGSIGGALPASIDFGVEEVYEDGVIVYKKIPIDRIIREMLHAYALEPYQNIIINNLDEKGLELLEYRGDIPMYLLYNIPSQQYINMEFDGDKICYISSSGKQTTIGGLGMDYNKRVDELLFDEATIIKLKPNGEEYLVTKVEFGQTAGYRLTELTYAGDLISSIGESITSILDKIVKMLGNFEYFYDLYGRFIFQAKKTYINTSWSPIIDVDDDVYVENSVYADKNIYYFNGNNLISSFSNNPDLKNVRNDYSIWGVRKGLSGAEIPIHFRYAIHKKPEYYKAFNGDLFTTDEYDWRELIYQMAVDYYQHNQEPNFYSQLEKNNPGYYPGGVTGYEQFYIDMMGFWRELYNPFPGPSHYEYEYSLDNEKSFKPLDENGKEIKLLIKENYKQLSEEDNGIVDKNNVYVLLNGELQKLIDTIPINYNFDKNGKQSKYFITADTISGYKPISQSFADRLEKKEIYVYDENSDEYKHILETVTLNNNCYLKEILSDDKYINILSDEDFPLMDIRALYYDGEKYNKYYTVTPLDIKGKPIKTAEKVYNYFTYYIEKIDYYQTENAPNIESKFWNINIKENPDLLNFWIDFLDTDESKIKVTSLTKKQYSLNENILFYEDESFNLIPLKNKDWDYIQSLVQEGKVYKKDQKELGQYSILAIGDRPKVVNDNNVKSIYYRNVPDLIFTTDLNSEFLEKTGYIFMQITENMSMNYFNISAQGKSAKDVLDELLYNHSYCTESINITAIPIYYLDVNSRISVYDELSKINGEYIVSRISLPLTYNGQMTIQATKAPQRFN